VPRLIGWLAYLALAAEIHETDAVLRGAALSSLRAAIDALLSALPPDGWSPLSRLLYRVSGNSSHPGNHLFLLRFFPVSLPARHLQAHFAAYLLNRLRKDEDKVEDGLDLADVVASLDVSEPSGVVTALHSIHLVDACICARAVVTPRQAEFKKLCHSLNQFNTRLRQERPYDIVVPRVRFLSNLYSWLTRT
jgi:hypothetical protein